MRCLLPLALPLLLCAGFAHAQGRGGGDMWARMSRMDEDGDGKVSADEFRGPERLYTRLDADKDGYVTKQETAKMRRGGRGAGCHLHRLRLHHQV